MIRIVFIILTILYGGLMLMAGTIQLMRKNQSLWPSLLMVAGSLLVIGAVILTTILLPIAIWPLVIGLLIIHISAVLNGYALHGKLKFSHHLSRLAISIAILILNVMVDFSL